MKKLFFVLAISILVQSCFSYKPIDISPSKMVFGQKYKIKQNNKTSKVTLNRISDSSIVVMKNRTEQQISLKDITSMKERKFSVVKTIALIPTAAVGLILLIIAFNPISIGMGEIEWPN